MSTTLTTRVEPKVAFVLPPHSAEAEEALLGALFLNEQDVPTVAGLVTADDFFLVKNGWIFQAICEAWQAGEGVNYVTVAKRLEQADQLEEAGGLVYFTETLLHTPLLGSAVGYALLIQQAADRRRWIDLASRIAQLAYDEEVDIKPAYSEILQRTIGTKPRALDQSLTVGAGMLDRFMELQSAADQVTVFPLPFGDELTALPFLTSGKLFGIGGDEKTGKSSLAETLAEHWASVGRRGFYIHTEEKPDAKILRRYSRWSGIPFLKLETGMLSDQDLKLRELAIERTVPWQDRLDLWYAPLPSPEDILMLVHRAVQVFGVEFVVLDTFTDVKFRNVPRGSSAGVEAAVLLQALDDLAARYNVLIVLTTQMSTQESGKRIAFGTSGFNQKMTWFWDINRTKLKTELVYWADGQKVTMYPGEYDPRVDLYQQAVRYGQTGTVIPVFADLRRLFWRIREEVQIINEDDL